MCCLHNEAAAVIPDTWTRCKTVIHRIVTVFVGTRISGELILHVCLPTSGFGDTEVLKSLLRNSSTPEKRIVI
jgi:hypothetical protein